jgi:hypothetical protein
MRHIRISFIVGMLLLSAAVQAQWTDRSGRRLAESESMKSAGDLGVQIVLTADGQKFQDTWDKSTTPPSLLTTYTVQRGASISAMVIFHGCAPTPSNKCDGVVHFTLMAPDGKVTPAGDGPLWTDPPTKGRLLLSSTSVTVGFDKADAVGKYRIQATVTDKFSGKKLQVSAPFSVR